MTKDANEFSSGKGFGGFKDPGQSQPLDPPNIIKPAKGHFPWERGHILYIIALELRVYFMYDYDIRHYEGGHR